MAFQVFSSAFSEGGTIPQIHTCDGANVSPPLEWSGAPAETKSFVLVVEDPDAPSGTWTHWLVYDLSRSLQALPAGAQTKARGGRNDFGRMDYGGPCPPRGHGPHRYYFKLLAVDVESLGQPEGLKRQELLQAVQGHVLASAVCMGRYERR